MEFRDNKIPYLTSKIIIFTKFSTEIITDFIAAKLQSKYNAFTRYYSWIFHNLRWMNLFKKRSWQSETKNLLCSIFKNRQLKRFRASKLEVLIFDTKIFWRTNNLSKFKIQQLSWMTHWSNSNDIGNRRKRLKTAHLIPGIRKFGSNTIVVAKATSIVSLNHYWTGTFYFNVDVSNNIFHRTVRAFPL